MMWEHYLKLWLVVDKKMFTEAYTFTIIKIANTIISSKCFSTSTWSASCKPTWKATFTCNLLRRQCVGENLKILPERLFFPMCSCWRANITFLYFDCSRVVFYATSRVALKAMGWIHTPRCHNFVIVSG